jgi:hypothetical protein
VRLQYDSTYINELGQKYTITNFKYYISNFRFIKANGQFYTASDHFLINEDEDDSKKIKLSDIPAGEYSAVQFIIGVDSLYNCSGAQSGALDPANGMFWAWNTGYIFLKLEGRSPHSTSPGNIYEYHIGGYKEPSNCIRKVNLKLKAPLIIEKNNSSSLVVNVNVSEIMKNPLSTDFSRLPIVTDKINAEMIANNYQDMFFIK